MADHAEFDPGSVCGERASAPGLSPLENAVRRLATAVLLAAVVGLLPPPAADPAGAQEAAPVTSASTTVAERRTPVWPGLERRHLSLRLDDGQPAAADVLAFRETDASLELRPVLAQGVVPGLETVRDMGSRLLPDGGVAGINGGFFLANPLGDPNGFYAEDGLLVSESQTQGAGPRGTAASLPDGRLVMDRLTTGQDVAVGSAAPARLNGVNRYHSATPPFPDGDHASFVYSRAFGSTVTVRALSRDGIRLPVRAFSVAGLQPLPGGTSVGRVQSVHGGEGTVAIPSGGAVIVSHGDHATRFGGAGPGDVAQVRVGLAPATTSAAMWSGLRHGLAAGPLIVQNGARTDPSTWETEGFNPGTHSNVRHPRSAIGRTADGQVLLVTVDGRQPGHSAGMTMHELSHLLLRLGAVDGLALDGGGSTQMVTDGQVRNRPCCDASLRPLATGLFVHHDYTFTATERLAGGNRAGTAAAVARAAHPGGADEVLLAGQHDFPDALAGGPLAAQQDAPLLLSGRDELPAETAQALTALAPRRVTLLGGSAVISRELETRLATRYQVRRISGTDRSATAAAVARELGATHPRAFLVVANAFPDALSASAPAGMLGMPILLTGRDDLPAATRQILRDRGVGEVVIAGGTGAVSQAVQDVLVGELGLTVVRLAGPSRYSTARTVNEWASAEIDDLDPSGLIVALGERFPDALAGGPLAAERRQLLMIVPGNDIDRSADARSYLADRDAQGLTHVTLLGGHAALSSYQQWQLDQLAR